MALRGTFYLSGSSHRVTLNERGLTWATEKSNQVVGFVPIAEILSCWACPAGDRECCASVRLNNSTVSSLHSSNGSIWKANGSGHLSPRSENCETVDNTAVEATESSFSKVDLPLVNGHIVPQTSYIVNNVRVETNGSNYLDLPKSSKTEIEPTLKESERCESDDGFSQSGSAAVEADFEFAETESALDESDFRKSKSETNFAEFAPNLEEPVTDISKDSQDSSGCSLDTRFTSTTCPFRLTFEEELISLNDLPPSPQIPQSYSCPVLKRNNLPPQANLRHCRHSPKKSQFPGLSLEFCERVKPNAIVRKFNVNDEDFFITDWRIRLVVFHHVSKNVIGNWLEEIWHRINGLSDRPRHLAIIINPVCGRKEAERIYMKTSAPLLDRAAIRTTVYKTTQSGDAQALALKAALSGAVDGVVAVGGDGAVAEVVNGLMIAAARRCCVDVNDCNAQLPLTDVRLGVIPGGSTDAYVNSLHGTRSVITATLQIVLGSRRSVDVAGVYSHSKLDRYVMSGLHLGYLGGLQETGSQLRQLGPFRDVVGFCKEVFLNRSYECVVHALSSATSPQPTDTTAPCTAGCSVCADQTLQRGSQSAWVELSGEYSAVSVMLVSLECSYLKHGLSPSAHLADGMVDVVLLPKCSHGALLGHLGRMASNKNYLNVSPVKVIRTSELHISSLADKTPVSYDGELAYSSGLVLKVHRQKLQVFCRGKELLSRVEDEKQKDKLPL